MRVRCSPRRGGLKKKSHAFQAGLKLYVVDNDHELLVLLPIPPTTGITILCGTRVSLYGARALCVVGRHSTSLAPFPAVFLFFEMGFTV